MLRAMFLPGGVTPEQTAFYVELFRKLTQTQDYKDYMEKQALKPVFLTGKDMLKFLEEDDALNKGLMTEAGIVAHGATRTPRSSPATRQSPRAIRPRSRARARA